jgi:hypothetical protein
MTGKNQIEVCYCVKSEYGSNNYASGSQRFTDWFDFADWLKQSTLRGPVLITSWQYLEKRSTCVHENVSR